jgi:glycosyltransferase involved in cell wall biosynthesis
MKTALKVLMINKFLYRFGGTSAYMFNLIDRLQAQGHEAVVFGMMHQSNFPSPYASHFVSQIDYHRERSILSKVAEAFHILYSFEAKRKLRQLVDATRPMIAHCHNIYHQLSPSILHTLKGRGIPIVLTAHDYKLICGSYKMLSHGKICERCCAGAHYHASLERCMKGAFFPSLVTSFEMYFHRMIGIYDLLDVIIAPSAFLRNKLLAYGFLPEKVVHIPNFVDVDVYKPTNEHNGYFVYCGRLIEEKGLKTLLRAMRFVKTGKLLLVGAGPQRQELESFAQEHKLQNVEFTGYLTGEALQDAVRGAMFAVLPSEWYENNPISILETFALGKPVIAANIGGIPEMITDGQEGLLFQSGSAEDLAEKITRLLTHAEECTVMGREARKKVVEQFHPMRHYERILAVYEKLLAQKGTGVTQRPLLN